MTDDDDRELRPVAAVCSPLTDEAAAPKQAHEGGVAGQSGVQARARDGRLSPRGLALRYLRLAGRWTDQELWAITAQDELGAG